MNLNMNTIIFSIVQSALIILKLCETTIVATWSWWMVFVPTWIYLSLLLIGSVIIVVCVAVATKNYKFFK